MEEKAMHTERSQSLFHIRLTLALLQLFRFLEFVEVHVSPGPMARERAIRACRRKRW